MRLNEEWKQDNGKYKCPYCNKEYTKKGICSHIICVHTEEGKNRISKTLNKYRKNWKGLPSWNKGLTKETDDRVKIGCEKLKNKYKSGQLKPLGCTAWSTEQHRKHALEHNFGGLTIGSGRGHSGWYNGIHCDSTYELVYLIYCLEHNIDIKRNKKRFSYIYENKQYNYYPDFIVNNEYIEIKGFMNKKDKEKLKQNPFVKVLFEEDIKYCFDYVYKKYNIKYKELKNLYNGIKS